MYGIFGIVIRYNEQEYNTIKGTIESKSRNMLCQ